MNNKYVFACALVVPLLTGCPYNPTTPAPPAAYFNQFDQFQAELAARSAQKIGSADDFKIIVTQVAYPIGTLMRAGSTIPIDYSACTPTSTPVAYDAPSLFPTYTLSKALAVDLGLDNEVINKLTDFGVKVSTTDKVTFSVKKTSLQTLADTDLKKTLSNAGCREIIKGNTAWLVRGYVEGQRDFSLEKSKKATIAGSVQKIASFNVNGSKENGLSLTDDKTVGFLQIISQVTTTAESSVPAFEKPTVQNVQGRTFIQQDRLDASDAGMVISKALKASQFNVMGIEKLTSSEMPDTAQVRLFNNGDRQDALRALSELQKLYPNAELKKIGLPAAPGHLEIWLPKVR